MTDSVWKVTEEWRNAWPGASAGVLAASGLRMGNRPVSFDESLAETEAWLRERYGGLEREEIRQTGYLAHYHRYYRSFGQNYHVQHQIESIARKGRKIPRRQLLVEIGFKWELRNGLLTGVHDFSAIEQPVVLDIASNSVTYAQYSGETVTVREGDMYFRDQVDVLSSIVAGPSQHGRVTDESTSILDVVYGVPGVPAPAIEGHLQEIWSDIAAVAPGAELVELSVQEA